MKKLDIATVNLRILRAKFCKTQKDISELLQLSTVQYAKKENQKAEFTLSEAKKLSNFFNEPIEKIFFTQT